MAIEKGIKRNRIPPKLSTLRLRSNDCKNCKNKQHEIIKKTSLQKETMSIIHKKITIKSFKKLKKTRLKRLTKTKIIL